MPRPSPLVLCAALLAPSGAAQEPAALAPSAVEAPPPRLVVLVSPGPLTAAQLDGLAPRLEGGLRRLWLEGVAFPETRVDHAGTELSPAAATLATGLPPRRHGIPGDGFLDRAAGTSRFATHDTETTLHAPGGVIRQATPGGDSPEHLDAPGLADHLRAAHPGSRRVSVAGDARLAVLLAGWKPELALWWDRRAGGFTSSSWYAPALPAWVLAWNEGWPARASGHVWAPLAPDGLERAGFGPDERRGEAPRPGGAVLPCALPTLGEEAAPIEYQTLAAATSASPLLDRFTVELAQRALVELELGADEVPDLLCIGLAGVANLSQLCGPRSVEVGEALLAADRALGALFDALDERVGEGRWVAALAGTSGLLPLPEALRERGVGARRVLSNVTRRALAAVRDALQARYGSFLGAGLSGPYLSLDAASIQAAELDPAEVRRVAKEALAGADDWIAGVYTLEELQGLEGDDDDPWLRLYRRAYPPLRAPDAVVRPAPWHLFNLRHGTSAGTLYPYDRETVLSFLVPGVPPARDHAPATTEDLLPTLLHLLGVAPAGEIEGRVLELRR